MNKGQFPHTPQGPGTTIVYTNDITYLKKSGLLYDLGGLLTIYCMLRPIVPSTVIWTKFGVPGLSVKPSFCWQETIFQWYSSQAQWKYGSLLSFTACSNHLSRVLTQLTIVFGISGYPSFLTNNFRSELLSRARLLDKILGLHNQIEHCCMPWHFLMLNSIQMQVQVNAQVRYLEQIEMNQHTVFHVLQQPCECPVLCETHQIITHCHHYVVTSEENAAKHRKLWSALVIWGWYAMPSLPNRW